MDDQEEGGLYQKASLRKSSWRRCILRKVLS